MLTYMISDVPVKNYHVDICLQGRAETRTARSKRQFSARMANVHDPGLNLSATQWDAGTHVLSVKIDSSAIEGAANRLTDIPPGGSLSAEGLMDTGHGLGREWLAALRMVLDLTVGSDGLEHPMVVRPLAEFLVDGFLLSGVHGFSDRLNASSRKFGATCVNEVMQRIEEQPDASWTVEDMAAGTGVSSHTLRKAFRDELGTSPLRYVRRVRLRRARADLLWNTPDSATVSEIARRWGFAHPGRFSGMYKDVYGETPVQTLRES